MYFEYMDARPGVWCLLDPEVSNTTVVGANQRFPDYEFTGRQTFRNKSVRVVKLWGRKKSPDMLDATPPSV